MVDSIYKIKHRILAEHSNIKIYPQNLNSFCLKICSKFRDGLQSKPKNLPPYFKYRRALKKMDIFLGK
jgi:hypothetical protein